MPTNKNLPAWIHFNDLSRTSDMYWVLYPSEECQSSGLRHTDGHCASPTNRPNETLHSHCWMLLPRNSPIDINY